MCSYRQIILLLMTFWIFLNFMVKVGTVQTFLHYHDKFTIVNAIYYVAFGIT